MVSDNLKAIKMKGKILKKAALIVYSCGLGSSLTTFEFTHRWAQLCLAGCYLGFLILTLWPEKKIEEIKFDFEK